LGLALPDGVSYTAPVFTFSKWVVPNDGTDILGTKSVQTSYGGFHVNINLSLKHTPG
jgi:hypothetical protein